MKELVEQAQIIGAYFKSCHETLVASKMEKGDILVVHSVVLQCYSLNEFSWLP